VLPIAPARRIDADAGRRPPDRPTASSPFRSKRFGDVLRFGKRRVAQELEDRWKVLDDRFGLALLPIGDRRGRHAQPAPSVFLVEPQP